MSIPETLTNAYLYQTAQSVLAGELSLADASTRLIATAEWGNPSDGEINQVDTLIQKLINSQKDVHFAYILSELNLAVCKAVGSPSQEVICANTVGEAITGLRDPRLTLRRIAVYKTALEIVQKPGDEWRAAILYNNLGNAYNELATGDRRENLQISIEYFDRASETFTLDTQPYAWANIQNNMATAYKSLPGTDDQNILLAIPHWNRALTVLKREVYPIEWANVQCNLGIAYKDLNSGDSVENISLAQAHLLAALEILTPDVQPSNWAEAKNALGNVFFRLATGNRSENLRTAITCFEEALTVSTIDTFPAQYAGTCVNLGNAWLSLPDGDQIENLRKAIEYYEQALTIYTAQDFPEENARTHADLAAAYFHLPAGDRAQNLRRAEQSLELALQVFTLFKDESQYAWLKTTQGAIYEAMAHSDPSRVKLAIDCFTDALEVYTPDAFPADYARGMDALGTLSRAVADGNPQENHHRAEQYYEAALKIFQPDVYPDDWASTQTNLGNCYLFWPATDRSQTLSKAIKCYQQALTIHTREAFPLDYARLMDGLGTAYYLLPDQKEKFGDKAAQCFYEALEVVFAANVRSEIVRIAGNAGGLSWRHNDWAAAFQFLAIAVDTLEEMWVEYYSPGGKTGLQYEHGALYTRLVLSCYALAQKKNAFDYNERSRSRYMLSLLGGTLQFPATAPAIIQGDLLRLYAILDDLHSIDEVVTLSSSEQVLTLIQREDALWTEMQQLLQKLAYYVPEYISLWQGQPQDFRALREMLQDELV